MSIGSEQQRALVSGPDLTRFAALAGGALLSSALPRRCDPAVARWLFRLYRRTFPADLDQVASRMSRVLPKAAPAQIAALAESHAEMRIEEAWGRMCGAGLRAGQPEIEIEGMERLNRALRRGRGAILWSMRLSSSIAIKQGFHRVGKPLAHLSSEKHGSLSNSRFGIGVVAPLYCRAESAYLAGRIKIPLDGSPRYLVQLKELLRQNACVSIFGEHQGRQNAEATVFGEIWRFGLGAPSLAWSEDAALLTVYATRTGPFRYRVVIDEEIPVATSQPRKRFARAAVQEFAGRLERRILERPDDWQGWLYSTFPLPEATEGEGPAC